MFNPIIISPHQNDRNTLRSMLETSGLYTRVKTVRYPTEAVRIIEEDPLIDIVFISMDLEEKRILQFLDSAKRLTTGKRCSYVVLAKQQELKSAVVVNLMMAGIHSFLTPPYTSEAIQEATLLATDVSSAHSRVRLRLAGGLLFSEIAEELGQTHHGKDVPARERLRNHAIAFRSFTGRSFLSYLDSVATSLITLSPTKRVERATGSLRNTFRRSIEELLKHTHAK